MTLFIIHAPAATLYVDLNSTNPVPPYASWSTAATNIQDAVDASSDGDLILVTNGVYQTGGRVIYGSLTNRIAIDKAVTVQSVNGPQVTGIEGYSVPGTTYGSNAVRCVYLTNNATLVGFTLTNGATQDYSVTLSSIDSTAGGIYCDSTNALIVDCVIVSNTASSFSAANTSSSVVNSGTLNNCIVTGNTGGSDVYIALLNDCIVTNNSGGSGCLDSCTANDCLIANNSGGGAFSSVLNNCQVSGNSAGQGGGASFSTLNDCIVSGNSASLGGGADWCTLNNCLVAGNLAYNHELGPNAFSDGGGAYYGTANNCTIVGNVAILDGNSYNAQFSGGGAYGTTLNNCIVQFNSESPYNHDNGYNYGGGATLNNCCTSPLPAGGSGNFASDPLLINFNGGNYRLQTNSPCINSGNNAYVTSATDLDGNPRIVGGTADIGAYEYQTPASKISYAWLEQYGLPITAGIDTSDLDGTGFTVDQDWIAGLDPTNALSVLAMLPPVSTNNPAGLVVSWESVSNRTYFLQSSTNLGISPSFTTIQSNLVGQPGITSFMDTNAVGNGPFFYRVGVQQ